MEATNKGIDRGGRRLFRCWAPASIAALLFLLSSGPHLIRSFDPLRFADDARQQVWPFLQFHDSELFQDDLVADYYLKCLINKRVRHKALFEFIASLPPDSLMAGWPKGDLESVRLVCGRRTLVDYENHGGYHRRYIELMRPRATLSIQATLSHTDDALRRLHNEYGVTHFLHNPEYAEKKPYYFEPFNQVIRETKQARGDLPYAAERLAEVAAVYRGEHGVVIDLRKAFAD